MKWNQMLSGLLVGSAACVATTSVGAIPPAGNCEKKPDVCCPQAKPGPFAFAFPKDIDLNCPQDFFICVDWLAFQAKEDGLDFALRNGNGTVLPITSGKIVGFSSNDHDYGYNPGVRVGMGFYVHHDAWEIDFGWTWLNITNYKNQSGQGSEIYYPIWLIPSTPNASWANISAAWSVHYNTLDANLNKPYHVSRYLILNPHFGVRAGWIDQHLGVHYSGTHSGVDGSTMHGDNDFWGFGARTGLKSEWIVGKGWSLFGNIAASLLFGQFTTSQQASTGTSNDLGFDLDYDFYQNVPNMEMQLGISWQKYFSKQRYRVSLSGAYEFHEWWDQNNLRQFTGTSTATLQNDTIARGNFSLDGFSLSLRFDI